MAGAILPNIMRETPEPLAEAKSSILHDLDIVGCEAIVDDFADFPKLALEAEELPSRELIEVPGMHATTLEDERHLTQPVPTRFFLT